MAKALKIAAFLVAACAMATVPAAAEPHLPADSSGLSGSRLALFGFGKSEPEAPRPPPLPPKVDLRCPKVMVQPGTAAFIQYERGRTGEPMAVRYQVRFSEFARECIDFGAEVGVRIGVAARALVGPAGTPGQTMEVPIRFVVLDDDRKVIVSRVTRLKVTIPPGQNGITFTHVEEFGVPMPADRMRGWDFRVGFDSKESAGLQG